MENRLPLLLLLAFLLPLVSEAMTCHPDDLRALRGFAKNLGEGGAVLLRASWSGASCCGWDGVGCDDTSGRVMTLWLPGRGLAGPIPGASLARIVQLRSLNLANNRLAGSIPSWIGELEHLHYLDLSDNSLVGEVPKSLTRLKDLTNVGLSLGMGGTNMSLYAKRDRRTLLAQPNRISGSNNTVRSGSNNAASGNDNTVISGNNNNVSGSNNTIITGSGNTVSGSSNVVSGNNHIIIDNNNVVSGNYNNVSGSYNTVSKSHNAVSGRNNTVTGSNDIVSGSNHVVPGSNKVVTGSY